MSYLFISYSSANQVYVRNLTRFLTCQGFDVWVDEERIDFGVDWWDAIVQGVTGCDALLVIMTPEAQQSEWVKREIDLVYDQKQIFPLLLAGDNWSLFKSTQYVDVRTGEFPPDPFFDVLARYVQRSGQGQAIVMPIASTTTAADQFNMSMTLQDFYAAREDAEWQRVSELLGKIRASGDAPPNFPMEQFEAEVRQAIGTQEEHDTMRDYPRIEWSIVPSGQVTLEAVQGYDGIAKEGKYFVHPFAISKYPITNAQYNLFLRAEDGYRNSRWWEFSEEARGFFAKNPLGTNFAFELPGDDLPRVSVSWYSAMAFCQWLSVKTDEQITLPTEGEWQHAAQGDDSRRFPWGNELDARYCNYNNNVGSITRVDSYPEGASPYEVLDMCGNAWEWCLTAWAGDDDILSPGPRVTRGGAYDSENEDFLRVTFRNQTQPITESANTGFRCVRFLRSSR